ncbi:MAG: thiamine phosphate synthase [Spirochaetales bacterium]|nr:thiamine phosphate synthase [Spirochaetales bacterium]
MAFEFGLYPVITEEFCGGRSSIEVLMAVLACGVRIVQLREKNRTKAGLYALAMEYRRLTAETGTKLIINDHIDIALAVGADGVHLGQDDLPLEAARGMAPDLIIGISTHNRDEIEQAEKNNATYINIGPLFETHTKTTGFRPLGLEYLKNVKTVLPFSVMGGIKKHHLPSLLEAGVKNIAMVTEITQADDIRAKVTAIQRIITDYL